LNESLQARSVVFNPHTTLTFADVESQISDFDRLLDQRLPAIEHDLDFKKNRGVTAAQYQEMEVLFHKYDEDKSGTIEKRELRVCLYSLGEDLTGAELDAGLAKYGKDHKLTMAQFKNFMVSIKGVIDTKNIIIDNLKFISRDKPKCPVSSLLKLLPVGVVDGMLKTAGKATDDELDYERWANVMFSR
jgi:Ca2+-binding EF-hand superfamily protein